jgi:hypothetical protein
MEADLWVVGNFDGAGEHDLGMPEDAVDAEAPGFVAGYGVGDFVGGPAVLVPGALVKLGWSGGS